MAAELAAQQVQEAEAAWRAQLEAQAAALEAESAAKQQYINQAAASADQVRNCCVKLMQISILANRRNMHLI